jgi:hypothetical protein
MRDSIVIRHPESLNNLSCIESILLSLDGVLTSGDYKIMAISSLNRNYFLDACLSDNQMSEIARTKSRV